MKPTFLLAAGAFIFVYGILNYYVGVRGWQSLSASVSFLNVEIYWVLLWMLAFSYIAGTFASRYFKGTVSSAFTFIGAYWLAAMLYFLIIIATADVLRLVDRWTGFLPRDFFKNTTFSMAAGLCAIILVTGLLVYGTWNARNPDINYYDITVNKMAGKFKELNIAMVSDMHLGTIVNKVYLNRMVDMINGLKPDIVLMPGDIVDEDVGPFVSQGMSESLKRIQSRYGVFASLGNHEYYGGHTDEIVHYLEEAGVNVLRDRFTDVAGSFYIAGREDKEFGGPGGRKRKEISDLLYGADMSLPVILMDHQPVNLEAADMQGVDLQVSGHTHGGQLFPNNLITRMYFEIYKGYLHKDNLHAIVTSGFGTWGPPVRICSSPEIVHIKAHFK